MKELDLGEDAPIFGAAAIAKLIGKSERTVRDWCKKDLLPVQKVGGEWMTTVRRLRDHFRGGPLQ